MKSVKVTSLPLIEVIQDLSTALNAKLSDDCDEYKMDIPSNLGIGYIQGLDFDGGIGLIQYDCLLKEDIQLEFVENDVHPLKFLYCSEGEVEHHFEKDLHTNSIKKFQGVLVASQRKNGHLITLKADQHIMMTSIEINREKFLERYFCDVDKLEQNLKNLFLDVHAMRSFYHSGDFSLHLSELINLMNNYTFTGFTRRLFLEAKAYELLSLQIANYNDDMVDSDERVILRQTELKRIYEAVEIINNSVEEIENIQALTKRVGMNAHKLQEGFKHHYKISVNEFIQNARVERAKHLLLNTDDLVSSIAEKVGWSSTSHFGKIFKEKNGLTPKQYRNILKGKFSDFNVTIQAKS